MGPGELIRPAPSKKTMRLLVRFLIVVTLIAAHPHLGSAESPVSAEWKQRMTESLRKRIIEEGTNPFQVEVVSATANASISATATEESLPILSSLAQLLTQAATETATLSQELRPAIDWPGGFWSPRNTEDWSWRKRFNWFQNEGREGIENATEERDSDSPSPPFLDRTTEGPERGEAKP